MPNSQPRRTDEFGTERRERRTDSDYIARVGEFIARWKILWALFGALAAWYGKTILEPLRISAQTTAEVQAINLKIDKEIIPRLDSADADRHRLIENQLMQGRILGYLSRITCLGLDPIDRVKGELDCKDVPIPAGPVQKGGL